MSSTFNPTNDFKEGPEKEWAAKLGALDWDNTRIVFTKRSLIEFLKYAGVSVDPNFHSISKLPRYAVMGKMTDVEVASEPAAGSTAPTENTAPVAANNTSDFRPSRRVREAPGGVQSFFLGDDTDETFDAPATKQSSVGAETVQTLPKEEETTSESSGQFRPSRRVRTAPGGTSQLASLWGDNDEAEAEPQFRPTRRVRERPGGVDSIADLL